MAISTPTLKETQANILADIEAEVGQTIPILSKAVFRILAFALAGAWIIMYKYGTDAFKQRFVQSASETFLALLGELVDVYRQPATTWDGTAEVDSSVDIGDLPASTQLVNTNTGIVYRVSTGVNLSIGTIIFSLASTQGGEPGNLNAGDEIDFVKPLPGLEETVEIVSSVTAGESKEALETYRQRVLDRYQKKPQGGALADYELWVEEAPNVINGYPYHSATPGQVNTYVEVDNQTDGIPTSDQLIIALNYIKYDPITGIANRRPVTAEAFTLPISRNEFTFEVVSLSPDTPEIRADIEAALLELMLQKAPYILGLTITRNDTVSRSESESVVQRIASAAGSTISGLNVRLSGALVDLHVLPEGKKAKRGTVTFS